MNNNLIYGISEKPKRATEWIFYTLQMVLSVFVATVLISQLCGTPISSCLLAACFGTLTYEIITKFKSPMFISSCGATVSAVCGALALNASNNNYLMVFIGGLIIVAIYTSFALLFKWKGASFINKILPPSIVGAITIVIGLNLASFEVTYTHTVNIANFAGVLHAHNYWEVTVAIAVMFVVALTSHYFKGFMKTIPFLFGIGFGYLLCIVLKVFGIDIINFDAFNNLQWYPDLTFLKWSISDWSWGNFGQVVLLFLPVALCAICEHISDHKTLSNIVGTDLLENPGLTRTLIGDGVASAVGTAIGGLPNTSYGESIGSIGFSKVASTAISTVSAIFLGVLSFIAPVTAFIQTIPSCVFGGVALILYGYIAASGLKTLINNKVDLESNKNLTIVSVVLCVGVSGIFVFNEAFGGVSLAMVLGVVLNLILKDHK